MAPGIFKRMAGEGWMGAFAQEHGGQDAYSYYAGQGYSDPIGAALRDKAWGDDFAKRNGGKGPDKGDWETHWYQTYNKQEEDELDAEGKPTGKKKTTIKGPMDEFAKAVEDAMQGVIDKKEPFKEALTTGPQSVIDMKPQIDEGYNGITDGWQAMVDAVIAYMQRKTGNFETEWEDELDAEGKPTGKKIPKKKTTTRGDRDFGGPVVTSGVYRLLKGEYVVSMPEQRDIQSIVRQASSNNVNRGGDSYSIAINGANANPKDIASAVMAEMRWQQSRRSGKMVY